MERLRGVARTFVPVVVAAVVTPLAGIAVATMVAAVMPVVVKAIPPPMIVAPMAVAVVPAIIAPVAIVPAISVPVAVVPAMVAPLVMPPILMFFIAFIVIFFPALARRGIGQNRSCDKHGRQGQNATESHDTEHSCLKFLTYDDMLGDAIAYTPFSKHVQKSFKK